MVGAVRRHFEQHVGFRVAVIARVRRVERCHRRGAALPLRAVGAADLGCFTETAGWPAKHAPRSRSEERDHSEEVVGGTKRELARDSANLADRFPVVDRREQQR